MSGGKALVLPIFCNAGGKNRRMGEKRFQTRGPPRPACVLNPGRRRKGAFGISKRAPKPGKGRLFAERRGKIWGLRRAQPGQVWRPSLYPGLSSYALPALSPCTPSPQAGTGKVCLRASPALSRAPPCTRQQRNDMFEHNSGVWGRTRSAPVAQSATSEPNEQRSMAP